MVAKSAAKSAATKSTPKPAARKKAAPAAKKPAKVKGGVPVRATSEWPADNVVALPIAAAVPIGTVHPSPLNPRRSMDPESLATLADSIVANGLLQAILVRPLKKDGQYEIICGARRHAAACLAVEQGRLPADWLLPIRIRACSDAELVELAATENLARADMDPLDEAEVYAALRRHVVPNEGEKPDDAVGRKLGVSRRTVFRRLQLLRLAPELQKALRGREINLQQAEAFSVGHHNDQRSQLKIMKTAEWERDAESIRERMLHGKLQADQVGFDVALYKGEIIDDPETGQRYLADRKEAERLFAERLEAELAELKGKYPWVETVEGHVPYGTFEKGRKGDKEAGAVVVVLRNSCMVEIRAPMLRAATIRERERETRSVERVEAGLPPEPAKARYLTQAQVTQAKEAKTLAMRRGVAATPKAAVALFIVALLGGQEIQISGGDRQWARLPDAFASVNDRTSLGVALAPVLAAVRGGQEEAPEEDDDLDLGESPGIAFRALMAMGLDELLAIQAALVAERIGTWTAWQGDEIGDSDLAIAIAETVGADRRLEGAFAPDEKYFAGYSRDHLFYLLRAHHLVDAFTRATQMEWSQLNKAKKGDLVAACVEAARIGFWRPEHFLELRYLDDATMKRTFDRPPPTPIEEAIARQAAE